MTLSKEKKLILKEKRKKVKEQINKFPSKTVFIGKGYIESANKKLSMSFNRMYKGKFPENNSKCLIFTDSERTMFVYLPIKHINSIIGNESCDCDGCNILGMSFNVTYLGDIDISFELSHVLDIKNKKIQLIDEYLKRTI